MWLTRDAANIDVNGNSAAKDLTEAYENNARLTVDNIHVYTKDVLILN